MSDAPEIPEAKDPFERRVALTIAIIAIFLSFVGNLGDNAKTDAIIKTNEASNQWGYYQAKSIKGQLADLQANLLTRLPGEKTQENTSEIDRLQKEADRYEKEQDEIKSKATGLQTAADNKSSINDRCDQSSLFLQVAVIVCSVSILAQSHKLWWAGILAGAGGIAVGITAFLL